MLEIDPSLISRYEVGVIVPETRTLQKLASALRVSVDDILNGPATTEWRIEAVFKKEEDWEMNKSIDMSASGPNMFLADVGTEKIALNLVGAPKSEEELDGLWAKLKPQIMKMIELRDGLKAGLAAVTA